MDIGKIVKLAAAAPELELMRYQHFFPDESLMDFAWQVADDSAGDPFPISSRLPGDRITISVRSVLFIMFKDSRADFDGEINNIVVIGEDGSHRHIGGWAPGNLNFWIADIPNSKRIVERLAYVIAVINEPRVVTKALAGNRHQRKQAQRGMGFAVDAWTRVSWDISKPTSAKIARDPTFHNIPMHWRRGHFRRAEAHFKGAMQRHDAIREDDRGLWWQWIEGQWVGHPAFGVKRSIHAPRLSGINVSRRSSA